MYCLDNQTDSIEHYCSLGLILFSSLYQSLRYDTEKDLIRDVLTSLHKQLRYDALSVILCIIYIIIISVYSYFGLIDSHIGTVKIVFNSI